MDDIWADTTGEKYLYRHRPANIFTLSEIQSSYLWAASRSSLNDPMEQNVDLEDASSCMRKFTSQLKDKVVNNIGWGIFDAAELEAARRDLRNKSFVDNGSGPAIPRMMGTFEERIALRHRERPGRLRAAAEKGKAQAELIKREIETQLGYGVVCFSRNAKSRTMMAHYAQNTGVVVCYEKDIIHQLSDEAFFELIDYVDEPLEIGRSPYNSQTDVRLEVRKRMFQKHLDWEYEREVRLLCKAGSNRRLNISEDAIKAICFDEHCNPAMIELVSSIVVGRDIDLFSAEQGRGYKTDFKPLNVS